MTTKHRRIATILAMAILAFVAVGSARAAVSAGSIIAEQQTGGSLGDIINYVILSLLGLVSIILIGLVIWYFLSLSVSAVIPTEIVDQMNEMLDKKSYDELMDFCRTTPTHLTNIVASGLARAKSGDDYREINAALKETGEEEEIKIEQRIGWLNLIGTVAPMMGLLGTVVGMLVAFDVIAEIDHPRPSHLAGGIRSALWTTVAGLTVAIPAMSFFFFFRSRVSMLAIELNARCEELFARFHRGEKKS